ncbi:ribonuclease R [Clostridium sp. CAG:433]|nr:ribonuclease R [Clostridium sp. CAG:433]
MREEIIELLGKEKRALSATEICDKLNLNTAGELKKLLDNLRILEEGYTVYRSNKDKYMLFENSHLLKGRLSVNKKGFGFVIVDGRDEDIYIDAKNMNGALNNDLVVVEELKGQNGKKTEGRVVKVLKKENNLIVGEYKIIDGNPHFIPDDKKLKMEIILDNKDLDDLVDGHKIQVSIVKEMGKYKYLGEVVKIIGHKNDPGVDILSIIYDHGINDTFTDEVMEEVNALPSEVLDSDRKGRKDLTDMTIFTIDGDDTKDIDDAISISKKGENYILGVHIADVSYYVKEGTALYKEAYSRGTSVYLVDRVVPMLPHKLSNGICSLNPNVDRLAISCIMEITPNGKIVSHDIFESVIRSRIQMTYKKVNKILNDEETPEGYEPFKDDLKLMWELAKILRKEKLARGYLDFDVDEPKILVDENCKPYDVVLRERGKGENMIEDFMIAANETVAEHVFYMGLPFVYRVHEVPDNEKVEEFLNSISMLGYHVVGDRNFVYPKSMKKILDQLRDKEGFEILSTLLLRCMKKAVYKPENLGHYGLASKCYTHFTSPIRRFPDTTVHNLLRKYIFNEPNDKELNRLIEYWEENLPALCDHASEKERDSIDCERDVESMKMAEYMESHIGEEYDGTISSVMNFGLFVQLDNMIEGLVHISEIKGDYYTFDETTHTLRGEKKGKMYKLGQKVRVVVTNASKENSTIDFNLVEGNKNGNNKQKS